MKFSISNIAWDNEWNDQVFQMMKENDFEGLEIAPTKIFPENPYEKLQEAKVWSQELKEKKGLVVPSMQSIWYGRLERMFGTKQEREELSSYTKKAIDFAISIGCRNLVFGCPKNRSYEDETSLLYAIPFFEEIGAYAEEKGTVIGMEANPPIYNTNYINDTTSALKLIKQVNCDGFKLNLDIGTMIQNKESVNELKDNVKYINHVHVSEPHLKPIEVRELHEKIANILQEEKYKGFISIEMGAVKQLSIIEEAMKYVRKVFTDEYEKI